MRYPPERPSSTTTHIVVVLLLVLALSDTLDVYQGNQLAARVAELELRLTLLEELNSSGSAILNKVRRFTGRREKTLDSR